MLTVAHRQDGGLNLLDRAFEPLARCTLCAAFMQSPMHIVVGKARAIAAHGGLFQHDPVRGVTWPLGRVLLRDTALDVHSSEPDLEESDEFRISLLIGVDCRARIGARKKELLTHRSLPWNPPWTLRMSPQPLSRHSGRQ